MSNQEHQFSGPGYAEHRRFWQQQALLREHAFYFTSALRAASPASGRACHTEVLSGVAAGNLERLAGGRPLESYIVLLSVWMVVLARYTHEDTVNIESPLLADAAGSTAVPATGRTPLVATIASSDTPKDLILKLNQIVVQSYRYQHFPWEIRLRSNGVFPDALNSTVLFSFEALHIPAILTETTHLHVHFQRVEHASWQLTLNYACAHFDAAFITRLARHAQNLLALYTDLSMPVGRLSMLDANEWRQVVVDWNQTTTAYSRNAGIIEVFQAQVQAAPEAPALVFGKQSYRYRELDAASDCFAAILQQHRDLRTDQIVALVLERSAEMIVAMLGILKSGAAFLPIEPDNPASRIAYMLQDADARLVISSRSVVDSLSPDMAMDRMWLLLEDMPLVNRKAPARRPSSAGPRDLAYLMYTSGSTGHPKGVLIEQRSVVRLVKNTNYINITPTHRVLQLSSYAFDGSTFEIFGALLNGACLHILSRDLLLNPAALTAYVQQQQINVSFITTALFNNLVDATPEFFNGFDYLLTGGQEVSPRHFRLAQAQARNAAVLQHVYGPTEGTTFSTYHVPAQVSAAATTIPIGKPISNSVAYILDQQGQPVPAGVEGELYVGGDGIARGYLNRPDLTAQKFLTNPFREDDIIYRTGDICCFDSQGHIHFRGRRDDQVKIRGFRIEPAEISRHILEQTGADQVFITHRVGANGNRELLAYIVMPDPPAVTTLRQQLQTRLPDFMIPAYLIFLAEMPVNQNGKVDVRRLPAPEDQVCAAAEDTTAPCSEPQRRLAAAWEQVLGRSGIGIQDNYFSLGGDSIKAIQIVARLHQAGWKMDIRQLFQHPTIAELADQIAPLEADAQPSISQTPVTGAVPLTPIQHWYFERELRDPNHFNQAVLLSSTEALNPAALKAALEKLLEHHDALRMRYIRKSPHIVQENLGREAPLHFEIVDLRAEADPGGGLRKIMDQAQTGLALETGNVMQAVLAHLPDGDRLLVVIHHLVVDGVSWRILLEDLAQGYQQYLAGQPIHLPPKSHAFKHWAEALVNYSRQETLLARKTYWQQVLAQPITPLPNRISPGRPRATFAAACHQRLCLSAADTTRLCTDVHKAYNTQINDILLTALARSLKSWHGGRATRIGLEGHGRVDIQPGLDISRTVGWFTTLFPVVLALPSDSNPGYQVRCIKEHLRSIPDAGMGYGILRYLSPTDGLPDASLAWHPEICFNYLGDLDADSDNLLQLAPETCGNTIHPDEKLFYDIEITGSITGGELVFQIVSNPLAYPAESVQHLANAFESELRHIIQHCLSGEAGALSPSDLDYDGLEMDELDALLDSLES